MRRIIVGLFILFLVGCTTQVKQPIITDKKPTLSTREQFAAQNYWTAKGRFAVTQETKGIQANFHWEQKGDETALHLWGPFGTGRVSIIQRGNSVRLEEANGKVTYAKTPETLIKQVTGWAIPVSGLRYWLRGLPLPDSSERKIYLESGLIPVLNQSGWQIRYQPSDNTETFAPKRVELQFQNIRLKILVSEWQ